MNLCLDFQKCITYFNHANKGLQKNINSLNYEKFFSPSNYIMYNINYFGL